MKKEIRKSGNHISVHGGCLRLWNGIAVRFVGIFNKAYFDLLISRRIIDLKTTISC